MHLEIVVNQNSDSIRIDTGNGPLEKGQSLRCPNPTAVIRILHDIFEKLQPALDDSNTTVSITEINEDSVKLVGEW